jgi:hypothetical protein
MAGQVRIRYSSLDEAVLALYHLFYRFTNYELYRCVFVSSAGGTRDALGSIADEFASLMRTLNWLILGTWEELANASVQFQEADKRAGRVFMEELEHEYAAASKKG